MIAFIYCYKQIDIDTTTLFYSNDSNFCLFYFFLKIPQLTIYVQVDKVTKFGALTFSWRGRSAFYTCLMYVCRQGIILNERQFNRALGPLWDNERPRQIMSLRILIGCVTLLLLITLMQSGEEKGQEAMRVCVCVCVYVRGVITHQHLCPDATCMLSNLCAFQV